MTILQDECQDALPTEAEHDKKFFHESGGCSVQWLAPGEQRMIDLPSDLDWETVGPCKATTLLDLFALQVAAWPDRTAIVFEDQRLSYHELDARSNRVAHHLRRLGVRRETLVALCLERSADAVVSILGILKAGGAYVPLDPAQTEERLAFYLADSQAAVIITTHALGRRWPAGVRPVLLDADYTAINAAPTTTPDPVNTPEDLAYIIYTSGSTGVPKGVKVTHHNVIRLFSATQSWFGFDERDVWALFHSYAFDFSVWEMWGALLYGGRLVIVSHAQSRALHRFARLLREQGVTVLNQTPSAFRQLMPIILSDPEGTALRYVIFG
jgi:non-ribosomal peptide synthetase component F